MEIQYIREWIDLAETMSFSKTAERLHISQSSLSRHIQTLEKELGEPLLIRSTRKTELTGFGRMYLPLARKIREADDYARKSASHYLQNRDAAVTLGVSRSPHLYLVTDSVLSFREAYPTIPVHMTEGSVFELRRELDEGRLHIATTACTKREKTKHHFISAGYSSLAAVLMKDHYLATYDTIPLHRLHGADLLVPEMNTVFSRELTYALERDGILPNIVYHGGTKNAIRLLAGTDSILIADMESAKEQMTTDMVIRPLSAGLEFEFGLEYTSQLTKNEKLFVSHIRKLFQKSRPRQL